MLGFFYGIKFPTSDDGFLFQKRHKVTIEVLSYCVFCFKSHRESIEFSNSSKYRIDKGKDVEKLGTKEGMPWTVTIETVADAEEMAVAAVLADGHVPAALLHHMMPCCIIGEMME